MTMKVSYYIDAPVDAVFDYFKDPESDNGLGYEVIESKMTEEGVGTYLVWRLKVAGIPLWRGMEVVTDVVPNRHITEKSSSAMVGTWEYMFEPEGLGTRLTMVHSPQSFWGLPPFANLVDYGTTRMSRLYIDRVRAKLEGKTPVAKTPGTKTTVTVQRKPAAKPRKPAGAR